MPQNSPILASSVMPDEPWALIHSQPKVSPTTGYRHSTTRILHPICPDHCSGKHSIDSRIVCPHCQSCAYIVWVHEYAETEGHYFYEIKAAEGSPPHASLPDHERTHPHCRDCGHALRRV